MAKIICLDRIKESCIAKSILNFFQLRKQLTICFEMKIFSSHTEKYFSHLLVAVQQLTSFLKREITCHILDYFQESSEVALGHSKVCYSVIV